MSMIEIKNVSKWYGDFQVLKNFWHGITGVDFILLCQ